MEGEEVESAFHSFCCLLHLSKKNGLRAASTTQGAWWVLWMYWHGKNVLRFVTFLCLHRWSYCSLFCLNYSDRVQIGHIWFLRFSTLFYMRVKKKKNLLKMQQSHGCKEWHVEECYCPVKEYNSTQVINSMCSTSHIMAVSFAFVPLPKSLVRLELFSSWLFFFLCIFRHQSKRLPPEVG